MGVFKRTTNEVNRCSYRRLKASSQWLTSHLEKNKKKTQSLKLECFSTIQAINLSNSRGKSLWVIVNRSEKQSKKNLQKQGTTATIKQFNRGRVRFKKQLMMRKNLFSI